MTDYKRRIIKNLCYTDLVYERINKKLGNDFTNEQIELFIDKILEKTDDKFYVMIGKNYYITNTENNIRITINSNSFRIITVDKIEK